MGKQKKTRKFSVAKKMIDIKDARMYVSLLHSDVYVHTFYD